MGQILGTELLHKQPISSNKMKAYHKEEENIFFKCYTGELPPSRVTPSPSFVWRGGKSGRAQRQSCFSFGRAAERSKQQTSLLSIWLFLWKRHISGLTSNHTRTRRATSPFCPQNTMVGFLSLPLCWLGPNDPSQPHHLHTPLGPTRSTWQSSREQGTQAQMSTRGVLTWTDGITSP